MKKIKTKMVFARMNDSEVKSLQKKCKGDESLSLIIRKLLRLWAKEGDNIFL